VAWGAWAVFLADPLHRDIPVCRWADQLSFDTSQPEGLKEGTWRQSEAWVRGGSGISGHQRAGRRGLRESRQHWWVGRETLRRAPEKTSPVFAALSRGYGVEWSRKRSVLHGNSHTHFSRHFCAGHADKIAHAQSPCARTAAGTYQKYKVIKNARIPAVCVVSEHIKW
jgi:hypothetical protein